MGHYCRICGRIRANERFSGRGHRDHICRQCQQRPRVERDRIEQLDEIRGFLRQTNISSRNIARLEHLCDAPDSDVRELAEAVLEVARVHPRRRHRWRRLAKHRRALLTQLQKALGLEWMEQVFFDAQLELPQPPDEDSAGDEASELFEQSSAERSTCDTDAEMGDVLF